MFVIVSQKFFPKIKGNYEWYFGSHVIFSINFSELAGSNWHGCNPKEDYGAITFRLPGQPFRVRGGKKNATLGKLFMVRLLEEMYKLGYHFIASSKLSRTPTDHSTLLFRKVNI